MKRKDPIVEEVRRARQYHARKHKYDLEAIFADMRAWQTKQAIKTVIRPPKLTMRATGS